ncbi:MAG: hypothetical protein JSS60_05395 [Verrucomicrobia bacterium]|nr:hypothetical protein [Verrucomicrobiota bacterium]
MPRLISKDQLERTLARLEEAFNLIGYIPFMSVLSATVRAIGGKAQALLGLCFAIGYFCLLGFTETRKIKHFFHLKSSFSQILHGICNIVRAAIEAVPFLGLVVCLPYDRLLKKRFKYDVENCTDIEIEGEEISGS